MVSAAVSVVVVAAMVVAAASTGVSSVASVTAAVASAGLSTAGSGADSVDRGSVVAIAGITGATPAGVTGEESPFFLPNDRLEKMLS